MTCGARESEWDASILTWLDQGCNVITNKKNEKDEKESSAKKRKFVMCFCTCDSILRILFLPHSL